MPLYEYTCTRCTNVAELLRPMDRRNDPAYCSLCEGKLKLQFVAPRALRTDTAFQASFANDGCHDEATRHRLHANARQRGINIAGMRYDGRLAKYWGDPEACYSTRSEAKKCVARSGQACEELGIRAPNDETTGRPYRVADDIVAKHAKEKVIDEHGGTVSRKMWEGIKEETREKLMP